MLYWVHVYTCTYTHLPLGIHISWKICLTIDLLLPVQIWISQSFKHCRDHISADAHTWIAPSNAGNQHSLAPPDCSWHVLKFTSRNTPFRVVVLWKKKQHTLLSYALLCYTILYYAVMFYAMLSYAVLCFAHKDLPTVTKRLLVSIIRQSMVQCSVA